MKPDQNVISLPRAHGKTTKAVEWLLDDPDNRLLICINAQEAHRIRSQHKLTRQQVISVSQITDLYGRRGEVAVDNIDLLGWRDLLFKIAPHLDLITLVTETWG